MKVGLTALAVLATACLTPTQVQTAENVVVDLTNAACTALAPVDNLYVDFVCDIVEGSEELATVLTPTVQTVATVAKTQVTVRVPLARAPVFAMEHTAAAIALRKARK